MGFFGRIFCLFGRHQRSRSRARAAPFGWRSVCRHCGRRMVKERGHGWELGDE